MNLLTIFDQRLSSAIHRILPTAETSNLKVTKRVIGPKRVAAALGPDHAFHISGLEFAMNACNPTILGDEDLGVEKGVAVGDSFGYSKTD